ncbi:unnamed protein product [Orchesella dallaii]|uniref:Ionotropic glutamate receptor C-terminal domain-containing protein n=1 Tax=Orchesella dallaii TaxID=48710 RepID=A0ABP1QMQ2_9HEXA
MKISVLTKILQNFHKCTLIQVQTQGKYENWEIDNTFYELLNNSIKIFHGNSYHFNETLPSFRFLPTYCNIVLTSLLDSSGSVNFIKKFSEIISSEQSSIQRDEDFFIFLCKNIEISQRILKSEIFRKTRYRFVLHKNTTQQTVSVFTSDLFHTHFYTLKTYTLGEKLENMEGNKLFVDFTKDLQGHALKVAATNRYFPTFEIQNISKTSYQDKRGLLSIIHKEIRRKLNTTYEIFVCNGFGVVPDGHSGFPMKNGSWLGCMGDVMNHRAELAMVVTCDANRFPHVECGATVRFTYITFITRKPIKILSWKAIYKSFTTRMWTAIFITIFFATCITSVGEFLKNGDKCDNNPVKLFGSSLFNLIKPLIYQSGKDMEAVSSKCLLIFWLIYTLIISTAYTSKLTALLTFPEVERMPRTLYDLSVSDFVTGSPKSFKTGLGAQIFKDSPSKTPRLLYSKMNFDTDDFTCIHNTKGSNCACLSWEVSLDFIIGTRFGGRGGNSPFIQGQDSLNQVSVSYVAQKREPLRHRINSFIRMSFDSGLLNEIYTSDKRNVRLSILKGRKDNEIPDENYEGGEDKHAKPLTIWNIQGSILIFLIGTVVAIFVNLVEIIFKSVMRIFIL